MSIEATRRLIEELDVNLNEEDLGKPFFSDPRVKTFPLNREGFHAITKSDGDQRIAFVDGGNQEIVGAPNFSVQINRIYFGIWNGSKRVVEKNIPCRIEFFSLTYSKFMNGNIYYNTAIFPGESGHEDLLPSENDMVFSSLDRSLMSGSQRADIGRVASIARGFAEWRMAANVVRRELEKGDMLVVDRSLQTAITNESHYLRDLEQVARQKGVIVSGLSKTSTIYTDTGLSVVGAIDKLASDCKIKDEWYFPVAEASMTDHNAIIFYAKFCADSDRIFRFEIQLDQYKGLGEKEINQVFAGVVKNSNDIGFPGYPYGLVDADRYARVSDHEVEYYQGLLLSQLSDIGKWEKLSRHMRALDAHSILNMLIG
jgi:hypothetical protein